MVSQRGVSLFHRILVPLDGSSQAEEALPLAAHLARTSRATLTLLRVVTPYTPVAVIPMEPISMLQQAQEAALTVAEKYLARLIEFEQLFNGKHRHFSTVFLRLCQNGEHGNTREESKTL